MSAEKRFHFCGFSHVSVTIFAKKLWQRNCFSVFVTFSQFGVTLFLEGKMAKSNYILQWHGKLSYVCSHRKRFFAKKKKRKSTESLFHRLYTNMSKGRVCTMLEFSCTADSFLTVLLKSNSCPHHRKLFSIELWENSSIFSSSIWKSTAPKNEENSKHGKSEAFPCYRGILGVAQMCPKF